MDLREKHYREVLLWKVEKMMTERGLDGIFFDTVDDLDYYFRDDPEENGNDSTFFTAILTRTIDI